MRLVVITSERILENEPVVLNRLFAEGLEVLHIRKPEATILDIRHLLDNIDSQFHDRIVLHDHFALTDLYLLKGVHLNRRNPEPPANFTREVSKSCHSLNELEDLNEYSYVFLSPVFDSISKSGYTRAFTTDELTDARDKGRIGPKVYALGGISSGNIPQVAFYGFGGVVVLGTLWGEYERNKNEDALLRRFNELRSKCCEYKLL